MVSKAQQRATAKYNATNYDRIEIKVAKGEKDIITQLAVKARQSVNAYINQAIKERMERDGASLSESACAVPEACTPQDD